MKKLLLLTLMITPMMAVAQHAVPRFGTASNQDATFRNQKLGLITVADAASSTTDTFQVIPNSLESIIKVTVTDSVSISADYKDSWVGDQVTFIFYNTSGANHKVYFTGKAGVASRWRNSSTGTSIALTSAKNAVVRFIFDGTGWSELSRSIQ